MCARCGYTGEDGFEARPTLSIFLEGGGGVDAGMSGRGRNQTRAAQMFGIAETRRAPISLL